MRHNDIISLISVTITEDEYANQIETEAEREVFANKYSVSATEFYNAAATGLRPSKKFQIYSFEYNDESKLKHDNIIYQIIGVDERGDKTIITCQKVIGNGN